MEAITLKTSQYVANDGSKYGSLVIELELTDENGDKKKEILRGFLDRDGLVKEWLYIPSPEDIKEQLVKFMEKRSSK